FKNEWRIDEPRPPICEQRFEHLALQQLALPSSEIGVLNGKLWKWRLASGQESIVENAQLSVEYPSRPPIRDNMVHGQQKLMQVVSKSDDGSPHQGTL